MTNGAAHAAGELLARTLGPDVVRFLADRTVVDILVRPWGISIDRIGEGLGAERIAGAPEPGHIEGVLRVVAGMQGRTVGTGTGERVIECDLPLHHARFAGFFDGPHSFYTVRIHRDVGGRLEEYARGGGTQEVLTRGLCGIIERDEGSIMVAGFPGAGKTTALRRAVLYAAEKSPAQHFAVVEDSGELWFEVPHYTRIPVYTGFSMADGARALLRHRPDWAIFGEVRGAEAKDVLVAAVASRRVAFTIHAHSGHGALSQFYAYCLQSGEEIQREQVVERIQYVVMCGRVGDSYGLREVLKVRDVQGTRWIVQSLTDAQEVRA